MQIAIAGVINAHVAAKFVYVRMFRGTKHMSKRTWLSLGSWILITLILWVVAWIIAESIPVFNDLLALISSLFASWYVACLVVSTMYADEFQVHLWPKQYLLALPELWTMVQELEEGNTDCAQLPDIPPWCCHMR
jgi:Na+-driven multidrug efflux pump